MNYQNCPNCKGKNFESGNSFILRTTQKQKFLCNKCGIEFWSNRTESKDKNKSMEISTPAIEFLEKCITIMKERYMQYGDYREHIQNTIDILTQENKLTNYTKEDKLTGYKPEQLTRYNPEDILNVLIATKGARQKYKLKEDNLIDEMNYRAMLYSYYLNK